MVSVFIFLAGYKCGMRWELGRVRGGGGGGGGSGRDRPALQLQYRKELCSTHLLTYLLYSTSPCYMRWCTEKAVIK